MKGIRGPDELGFAREELAALLEVGIKRGHRIGHGGVIVAHGAFFKAARLPQNAARLPYSGSVVRPIVDKPISRRV